MAREDVLIRSEMAAAPAPPDPRSAYTQRLTYFATLRDRYNRSRYLWANLSAVSGLGALLLVLIAAFSANGWWLLGALAAAALFVVAFGRQAYHDERYLRYIALCLLTEEGHARLRRDWNRMTLRGVTGAPADANAAANALDLDLLGHASVQHLLHTVTTPAGQRLLTSWLQTPASPDEIRARQAAVRELAPSLTVRDELSVFGKLSNMTADEYERFVTWSADTKTLVSGSWLSVWSFAAPIALVALAIAQGVGLLPYPLWLVVVVANMGLVQLYGKRIEAEIDRVAENRGSFLAYANLFSFLGEQSFASPLLRRTIGSLAEVSGAADERLRVLGRIMRFVYVRLSFIGPILQLTLLWNIHGLRMLENWRTHVGGDARMWFELLAEMEALAGLAALSFDNPEWAFPTVRDMPTGTLEASGLGHPLLPPEDCVRNDVTIGPAGRFLLVTGSNMSGKSTLLRAIGVNVALAQAGAPVCAVAMSLPPIALATSMRAQDSLEAGVSYFMAELRRLKQVVDVLRAAAQVGDRLPVFLLDEILSGTNTSEREIAARTVIRYMLDFGATGAVSTHDLSLAQAPDLTPLSQPVHFTERFTRDANGPAMSFDFILRPGIATSVNALKLMELVGLPTPAESEAASSERGPVV